jgi:LAO/AO transport system kinase
VEAHRRWLAGSGEGARRRAARAAGEIEAIALTGLRERIGEVRGSAALAALADEVVAGRTDPHRAADRLLASM